MEQTVEFRNKNGRKLFGIVHVPEQDAIRGKRIGINLLNPGIKYRVAPNRLNVKIARKLCLQGYYVMRFDPEGIGDSEGDLPKGGILDVWSKIQTGLFVQDAITANDHFIKQFNIGKLILIGSCGGAITSLLASARDTRVDALCLIDVPVFLLTPKMSLVDLAVEGGARADWLFSEYLKRLLKIESWYRFLTLKTDYRGLLKTFKLKVHKLILPISGTGRSSRELDVLCSEKNLNRMFFDATSDAIDRGRKILYVMAQFDHGTELFQQYAQNLYLKEKMAGRNDSTSVQIRVIENANHIYTFVDAQEKLISTVSDWMNASASETFVHQER